MDMTRNEPNRTPPINPVRILRAWHKVYSVSQALISWLKHATFSIEHALDSPPGHIESLNQSFQ
jgi:hypothetical protein